MEADDAAQVVLRRIPGGVEMAVQCRRRKIGSRRFEVSLDVQRFSRSAEGTEHEDGQILLRGKRGLQ